MRTMLKVTFPVEAGNRSIKDGTLPKTIQSFIQQWRPEASYFYPENGKRAALFFFDLKDPTQIPAAVEPLFMNLDATVELTPVMNAEDLKTGLEKAFQGRQPVAA